MNGIRSILAASILITFALVTTGRAQVLIDFENLPVGTVVTNQYPEVTFSAQPGIVNTVLDQAGTGHFICSGQMGAVPACIDDTYLDFTAPVSGLTFLAIQANCNCMDAQFHVFQGGALTATVDLFGIGGVGNEVVDLSAYSGITRLEIVNILNDPVVENGIGWDQFSFTPSSVTSPFCFGDGSGTACPCMNAGVSGNGCGNSVNATGAHIATGGSASIAHDRLFLLGSGMPNSSALFFQGNLRLNGGAGVTFGDGLRCIGGSIVRLGVELNASGASRYPSSGDASISVRANITLPGTRSYQVWYRNAASFCTASTFNLSNAIEVNWSA